MSRYEDFSVGLVRIGNANIQATGNPAGAAATANGNAGSSSIVYAYLVPTVTTANTELIINAAISGLQVGDVVVYVPQGGAPALNGAAITRAWCTVAGTLNVGFLSGAAVTPATGMYRFLVMKPN